MAVVEICRTGGFLDATFCKERAKFGGMEVADGERLRELESKNAKLKRLLAKAQLDMHSFKIVLEKKEMTAPQVKRDGIRRLLAEDQENAISGISPPGAG